MKLRQETKLHENCIYFNRASKTTRLFMQLFLEPCRERTSRVMGLRYVLDELVPGVLGHDVTSGRD